MKKDKKEDVKEESTITCLDGECLSALLSWPAFFANSVWPEKEDADR